MLNVSYKPQKIAPSFNGSVRKLLYAKIATMMNHQQFTSDVVKPMKVGMCPAGHRPRPAACPVLRVFRFFSFLFFSFSARTVCVCMHVQSVCTHAFHPCVLGCKAPRRSLALTTPSFPYCSLSSFLPQPLPLPTAPPVPSAAARLLALTHARTQIDDIIDQEVKTLSGGELQRVALVLSLGVPADIYLIDEPSAYLDSEQRLVAAKVIKRFVLHAKKTAFIVEHDFIMSTYLADRVIVYTGQPAIKAKANKPQVGFPLVFLCFSASLACLSVALPECAPSLFSRLPCFTLFFL